MLFEEYGKVAYKAAQILNYKYTEDWEDLPQEGKQYWTAITTAVYNSMIDEFESKE